MYAGARRPASGAWGVRFNFATPRAAQTKSSANPGPTASERRREKERTTSTHVRATLCKARERDMSILDGPKAILRDCSCLYANNAGLGQCRRRCTNVCAQLTRAVGPKVACSITKSAAVRVRKTNVMAAGVVGAITDGETRPAHLGIVLIDHGSKRPEANAQLVELADLYG